MRTSGSKLWKATTISTQMSFKRVSNHAKTSRIFDELAMDNLFCTNNVSNLILNCGKRMILIVNVSF